MKPYQVLALLLTSCALSTYAGNFPKVEKKVIIDETAAAALTNKVEISLHQTRIPEVEFAQAHIRDIIDFLNSCIEEYGSTKEAKSIQIVLDPHIVFSSDEAHALDVPIRVDLLFIPALLMFFAVLAIGTWIVGFKTTREC